MTSKSDIRRQILARRDRLTEAQRQQFSLAIRDRFFSLPAVSAARRLMLFLAFGSEVNTWLLLEEALARGQEVVAPVCRPQEREMLLYPVRSSEEPRPGYRGIYEPLQQGEPVAPETLDVVVVPGVAFDERGGRIGYGGGYYDRFLPRAAKALRVAVAYELQLVPAVPQTLRDVPVDRIVTEQRIIVTRRSNRRV